MLKMCVLSIFVLVFSHCYASYSQSNEIFKIEKYEPSFIHMGKYSELKLIFTRFQVEMKENFKILGGFDHDGREYQKTYLLSRHLTGSWTEAKSMCCAFDLDFASFETENEMNSFRLLFETNEELKSLQWQWILIDGINKVPTPRSKTDWYWTNSGNKIAFHIPWIPGQPDCAHGCIEHCLSIGRHSDGIIKFNDYPCKAWPTQFICQHVDFKI